MIRPLDVVNILNAIIIVLDIIIAGLFGSYLAYAWREHGARATVTKSALGLFLFIVGTMVLRAWTSFYLWGTADTLAWGSLTIGIHFIGLLILGASCITLLSVFSPKKLRDGR